MPLSGTGRPPRDCPRGGTADPDYAPDRARDRKTAMPYRRDRCLANRLLPPACRAGLEATAHPALTGLMFRPGLTSSRQVAPFTVGTGYSGTAAIPKVRASGGDFRTPAHRGVLSSVTYRPVLRDDRRDAVGLSPVSVSHHCAQAKPPYTPPVRRGSQPCAHRSTANPRLTATLRYLGVRGVLTRPTCGSSRTIPAWPLRRQLLLPAAGCVPLRQESSSRDFRTGTDPPG